MQRRDAEPLADALEDVNARLAAARHAAPARGARELAARRAAARRRQRRARARRGDRRARAADARGVPAAPRRGARALGVRRRDLPHLPAALQVRARPADPARADAQPALRDPRPPGARALPRLRRRRLRGRCCGCSRSGWRRGGFSDSDEERQLREKARVALLRYHEPPRARDGGEPRWFERSFTFPLGRHHIRGRVDRVDALAGGGYELIDYKTGVPKRAEQLREDVQLALYAVAAREAWQLEATERTYYYVLDDARVRLGADDGAPRAGSRTRSRRSAPASWRRASSRRPRTRSARCASTGSPARPPRSEQCLQGAGGCMHPPAGRCMHRPGRRMRRPELLVAASPRWRRKRWNSRARRSPEGMSSSGSSLRSSCGELLEPLDERLDVGVALHRERRPGARSRPPRSRARCRRRRRRRGPRAGAAARAPPSGWAPRRRSGGRSPTGSPPGSRAPRTRRGARRRSRSGPRSRSAAARGARSAPRRRSSRETWTGSVCGTSASSAPSDTTSCTPSASARSVIDAS